MLIAASKRLYVRARVRVHAAYLRWLIIEAERDAAVIQAESLAAPKRLIHTRIHISALSARLAELEARS